MATPLTDPSAATRRGLQSDEEEEEEEDDRMFSLSVQRNKETTV